MQDPSELQLGLGQQPLPTGLGAPGTGVDVLFVATVDPAVTIDASGAIAVDSAQAGREQHAVSTETRAGPPSRLDTMPMPGAWAGSTVISVAFHPTLPLVAASDMDGHVVLWRVGVEDP